MKALYYVATQTIEMQEAPEPIAQPDECLIDLAFCGICGSDMHAYHGHDSRRVPPLVLGHEAVGTGRGGALHGKRVAVNPLLTCGHCPACVGGNEHLCASRELIGMRLPGAFSERIAMREANLTVLPDHLSFEIAALAEPLACVVHAIELGISASSTALADSSVVILGGGAIGLLAALVFEHKGVGQLAIAETNALRRDQVSAVSNGEVYCPINDKLPIEAADVIFDAVGAGVTRSAASALVRPGGTIIHIGLQDSGDGLDTRRITLQEIKFIGTYGYTSRDFAAAIALLSGGLVGGTSWIDYRPLSAGGQGFADIHSGSALPKIVLEI